MKKSNTIESVKHVTLTYTIKNDSDLADYNDSIHEDIEGCSGSHLADDYDYYIPYIEGEPDDLYFTLDSSVEEWTAGYPFTVVVPTWDLNATKFCTVSNTNRKE